jgi:hypothetical protein
MDRGEKVAYRIPRDPEDAVVDVLGCVGIVASAEV